MFTVCCAQMHARNCAISCRRDRFACKNGRTSMPLTIQHLHTHIALLRARGARSSAQIADDACRALRAHSLSNRPKPGQLARKLLAGPLWRWHERELQRVRPLKCKFCRTPSNNCDRIERDMVHVMRIFCSRCSVQTINTIDESERAILAQQPTET